MKFRCEVQLGADEEIVIKCSERSEKIKRLEKIIENALGADAEMILTLGDAEYFVPKQDILFFETSDGKVTAHTRERMYYADSTLFQLEGILPNCFMRVSKSCILNVMQISAISHNITGNGEVLFKDTAKKVYVSRGYYKALKEKIYELRGLK
jgi:DNA-binding LytR/AlgR family response regulator